MTTQISAADHDANRPPAKSRSRGIGGITLLALLVG